MARYVINTIFRVSAKPEMHHGGRNLEFQNGDLFTCKTCLAWYYFAINFSLKLAEVSILTIKHLQLSDITLEMRILSKTAAIL